MKASAALSMIRQSFARLIEGCQKALSGFDGAVLGVAPHSLRAVTPDELTFTASLLPEAPVHIHIAEQVKEAEDCIAWSGQRPVGCLITSNCRHAGVSFTQRIRVIRKPCVWRKLVRLPVFAQSRKPISVMARSMPPCSTPMVAGSVLSGFQCADRYWR